MARWKTKLWEPERFSLLADRVQKELNVKVVFTGSEQDRGVIDEIVKAGHTAEAPTMPVHNPGDDRSQIRHVLQRRCFIAARCISGHGADARGI